VNNYKSIFIAYDFIAINLIYKTRFLELIKQINFVIAQKQGHFKNLKFYFSYYITVLRNYYFTILYHNVEYLLLFFFLNKQNYINLTYNNRLNALKGFIYSNFVYRYYIYNILIETHYYKDWFHD
jgi:hypothetical protein